MAAGRESKKSNGLPLELEWLNDVIYWQEAST